ncbi:30S ribosomal protein S5 [Mycoplasma bradburyae]|uniref:Small ribosomal subunit protein uS5 n=1 Tax=Mycoplasma bradburyae TaxID=2963128 RepID=A0AAW6HRM1_9MOLU|nr:30S ribosomal protein S5 [Mycoplasma bradburyae]MDC4163282.1 30S ribosomal protein S5 [Mycoplasma bradburyae]MDC4181896.1 30S ribosomal protein S5 [Mycoplasma bradburyae]MDC4182595.1 30S ribosomal protein S5 [Mycoplasma bradburyae]MDC4183273.1 30S ribosomal protein S5 [Mycoplasma bradburyae]MDC4184079.1 30S ribosomal protein S5 [Mycoplasma bradburyae]
MEDIKQTKKPNKNNSGEAKKPNANQQANKANSNRSNNQGNKKASSRHSDERNKRKNEKRTKSEYEEKIVKISRISKTTKGGRTMRFSALALVADRKGSIGFATAKALEVPNAIKKALKLAQNNLQKVPINKHGTLFHEVIGKAGASKVLIKPAPPGTGIIAGGAIRAVLELAGYTDVYTKNLGKNTPINMVRATIAGIKSQFTPKQIAKLRNKSIKEL